MDLDCCMLFHLQCMRFRLMVSMEEGALLERAGHVGRPLNRDSFDNDNTNENHNGFSCVGWRQHLENGDSYKPNEGV